MPGLVHSRPKGGVASLAYGIHVLAASLALKDQDGRDKPGHDGWKDRSSRTSRATRMPAERYLAFARDEAAGRSPLYEEFSTRIAHDSDVLVLLSSLPTAKQQPNLLFAAVKHDFGVQPDWAAFRATVLQHWSKISATMMARSTQTNEAARCATLLPALMQLPQPLALIEVGASAGLCLLPDRYAYDFDGHQLTSADTSTAPRFVCRVNDATPIPSRLPDIAWRAGLDLNPIDVRDDVQCAWLEALVWPGQEQRLANLRSAMAVARKDPPRLKRGNLLHDLAELAADAPRDATLVVFHTAVLAYVRNQAQRDAFAHSVRELGAVWISNEAPGVFPAIAAQLPEPAPRGKFVLAVDGRPVAFSDPHGAVLQWITGRLHDGR